jgi:hypothetical protein
LVVSGSIPVFKSDGVVINGFDSIVGYGDPMRISAKIFKYLLGSGKGAFGIRYPFCFEKGINQLTEGCLRLKGRSFTRENQFVFAMSRFQKF